MVQLTKIDPKIAHEYRQRLKSPPFVIIDIDGETTRLVPNDVPLAETLTNLADRAEKSRHVSIRGLEHILRWPAAVRLRLILWCKQVDPAGYCAARDSNSPPKSALLDVFTTFKPTESTSDDIARCTETMLQIVAVNYAAHPDSHLKAIQNSRHGQGLPVPLLTDLRERMKIIAADAAVAELAERPGRPLRDHLAEVPDGIDGEFIVPAGWNVSVDRMQRVGDSDPARGVHSLVLIIAKSEVRSSGENQVQLAWFCGSAQKRRWVDRAAIAHREKIVNLAQFGLPVTSLNADMLIDFLARLEAANAERLVCLRTTDKLGWHGPSGRLGRPVGEEALTETENSANGRAGLLPRSRRS